MENFKFKVGDKVRLDSWIEESYVTINYIGNKLVFLNSINGTEWVESLEDLKEDWELYKEPKQKIKLQKFYVKTKDIWSVSYSDKRTIYGNEDCLNGTVQSILTEEEFLEKFEIRSND